MPSYLIVHSSTHGVRLDVFAQPPVIDVSGAQALLDWGDVTLEVEPGDHRVVVAVDLAGGGREGAVLTVRVLPETGTRISFAPPQAPGQPSMLRVDGQWPADAAMAYYAARSGRALQPGGPAPVVAAPGPQHTAMPQQPQHVAPQAPRAPQPPMQQPRQPWQPQQPMQPTPQQPAQPQAMPSQQPMPQQAAPQQPTPQQAGPQHTGPQPSYTPQHTGPQPAFAPQPTGQQQPVPQQPPMQQQPVPQHQPMQQPPSAPAQPQQPTAFGQARAPQPSVPPVGPGIGSSASVPPPAPSTQSAPSFGQVTGAVVVPGQPTGQGAQPVVRKDAYGRDRVDGDRSAPAIPTPGQFQEYSRAERERQAASQAPQPQQQGWYPDPYRRSDVRWFDGSRWTPSVMRGGRQEVDPV